MKDTYLQIRVSDNLKNDVKRLAANENKNISEYVTDLLKEKVIESKILGERKTMNIKDLYNNYRTYYRCLLYTSFSPSFSCSHHKCQG